MDPFALVGAEGTGHKARFPLKFKAVESENPLPEERKKWCTATSILGLPLGLLSLPFLVFQMPVVKDALTHTKKTGYDRAGKTVALLSPREMKTETIRIALLGSIRYGKPFVIDMMHIDCWSVVRDK